MTHALEEAIVPKEIQNHKDAQVLAYDEISINYASTGELWDRTKVVINKVFFFAVATEILKENDDHEPRSVDECRSKHDWSKWKEAIQVELDSLTKRKLFGPIVPTPDDVKLVGYKWVFVRNVMIKTKFLDTKHVLWHKVFHKELGLIMMKRIHL